MVTYNFIDESTAGSGSEDVSDIVELVGEIAGAEGGDQGGFGGNGRLLQFEYDVSGFDTVYWHVGGEGGGLEGGENGGGDGSLIDGDHEGASAGGASDIRVSADVEGTRVVVAGGGGGGGTSASGGEYDGGDGGFLDGEDGDENSSFSGSGGQGGISENNGGGSFAEFEGEGAGAGESIGGAGGGGYWAGSSGDYGSGGGGGASYVDAGVFSYTDEGTFAGGDGKIAVDAREAASADISIEEFDPYFAGQTLNFDANVFPGHYDVSTVSWDMGDDTTKSGEQIQHSYDSSGTYTVEVTVTDTEGYETVVSRDITIENPVDPSFSYNTPVEQGFDTDFTDNSSVNSDATIDDEFWRVGGDRVSSNTNLTYSFGAPGQIIVEKVFVAYNNEYTDQATVDVQPAATVDFSFNSPVVSEIAETFTDQTSVVSGADRQEEQWVIDGTLVGTNENLTYTFDSAGDYTVGKIVTVNGYDYSSGQNITVLQNTTANFNYTPDSPLIDEQISFTDESVTPFNITSYSWDFDDGTTSTSQNPSHTYTERGEYNVQLTVEDDEGQTDSTAEIVTVFSRKPTVETDLATNIGDFESTLEGRVVDVGVDSSADVYFEYRETGASTWNQTPVQTVSETGPYSETVTGLNIETEYEFRAVGENSEGTLTGSTVTFSTNNNTPPTVDSFTITPDPIERNTATDVQIDASDQVGINEVLVEWYYEGSLQTSQTLTFSSANSISETLSSFYTPTQFGGHQVAITITDDLGAQQTATINQTLEADTPSITLNSPGDQTTLGYSETFDYKFSVGTGNSEAVDVVLVVIDPNDNRVQEENVGNVPVNDSESFTVTANQVETPNTYDWGVEVDYETNNFTTSDTRTITVSEPSNVSVETGQVVSGGYGFGLFGDGGYGEEIDAIGFNYFNAEGGLIFSGDSAEIDLYFRYREQGTTEWKETAKEVYDNV